MLSDAVPIVSSLLVVKGRRAEVIEGEHAQETERSEEHLFELVDINECNAKNFDLGSCTFDGMDRGQDVVDNDSTSFSKWGVLTLFLDNLDGKNIDMENLTVSRALTRDLNRVADNHILRHLGLTTLTNKKDVIRREFKGRAGSIVGLESNIIVPFLLISMAKGESIDLGIPLSGANLIANLKRVHGDVTLAENIDDGILWKTPQPATFSAARGDTFVAVITTTISACNINS